MSVPAVLTIARPEPVIPLCIGCGAPASSCVDLGVLRVSGRSLYRAWRHGVSRVALCSACRDAAKRERA